MSGGKVDHLIVDTNAFVKNLPLHEFGDKIYTTRDVIDEIRDSATKQRLEVLPYDLIFREPHSEFVQLVTKLAKSTGDYASLSAVDIRLIALAYQITKEELGPDASALQLKTEIDPLSIRKETILPEKQQQQTVEEVKEEEEDDEDEDDDEGGGDWITPSNYKQKIKELQHENGEFEDVNEETKVACLTNDFSMQNLMLHIGLKPLSSGGMLIKQLRTYILRCYACFKTTTKMDKMFCPNCGHKTLKRVSITVDPSTGSQVIHLSNRVTLTGRGKKFSLPTPQGGKHSHNPILVEDQPIPQQRPSKQALRRNNPLDVDYTAGNSPFVTKDVYSRAAILGINYTGKNYFERKNPNEPRRATGNPKRNTK